MHQYTNVFIDAINSLEFVEIYGLALFDSELHIVVYCSNMSVCEVIFLNNHPERL